MEVVGSSWKFRKKLFIGVITIESDLARLHTPVKKKIAIFSEIFSWISGIFGLAFCWSKCTMKVSRAQCSRQSQQKELSTMNNGFPSMSLSSVASIEREDVKHFNPDGSFWVCTRFRFQNQDGITLLTISLYGQDNIPHGPEINTQLMKVAKRC